MKKIILSLLALTAVSANAQIGIYPSDTRISPTDSHIQYVGRISFDNPEAPKWGFPGIQINTAFTGSTIRMIAKPQSGYFMAKIDDCQPFKVGFNAPQDSVVTLATALSEGTHTLRLMYINEGYDRIPEFRGFLLDKGARLASPAALPKRTIEFIGNSITCGYGNEAASEAEHFSDETSNHYYSYASITARNLNAVHYTVARSGAGVYRNYNGPVTGDPVNMNTEYTHLIYYNDSLLWDFSRYTPQLVCINLGTNDTSTTGADENLLTEGYRRIYSQVRNHYPKAKILFLSGTMMDPDPLKLAQKCMKTVIDEVHAKGDKQVYSFNITPYSGPNKYGADWHPSLIHHQFMADQLTKYISDLMNWK